MLINECDRAVTQIIQSESSTAQDIGVLNTLKTGCATLQQLRVTTVKRLPRPNRTQPRSQTGGQ